MDLSHLGYVPASCLFHPIQAFPTWESQTREDSGIVARAHESTCSHVYLTHMVCRPSITYDCSKCLGPRRSHSGLPPQQSTTQIAFVPLYVLCETRNAVYLVNRSPHTETARGSILPPLFPIHFLLFSSLLLFLILILLKFPIFLPHLAIL